MGAANEPDFASCGSSIGPPCNGDYDSMVYTANVTSSSANLAAGTAAVPVSGGTFSAMLGAMSVPTFVSSK